MWRMTPIRALSFETVEEVRGSLTGLVLKEEVSKSA